MSGENADAIKRARDLAMRMMVEARIPECGHFAAIAQDLDAVCADRIHDRDQSERRIVDGLKAFCDCEPDFDMSPRMRARAAEFILGQPVETLPPLSQANEQFAENAKNLKPLEFRPRDDGKFDEIVARFQDGMVHVETLNAKACYVGFYWDDGRYCQWWINGKSPLKYHHDDGQNDPPRFTAWGVDRKPNPSSQAH